MSRFVLLVATVCSLCLVASSAEAQQGTGFSFGSDNQGNSWTAYNGGSWGYAQDNHGNMVTYNRIGSSTFYNWNDGSSGHSTRIGPMTFYSGDQGNSGYGWSQRPLQRTWLPPERVIVPVRVPVPVPVYYPQPVATNQSQAGPYAANTSGYNVPVYNGPDQQPVVPWTPPSASRRRPAQQRKATQETPAAFRNSADPFGVLKRRR